MQNETWRYFQAPYISKEQLDILLADGWRHFGELFFRNQLDWFNDALIDLIALRIDLSKFTLKKNQRKILRQNQDIEILIRPAMIDTQKHLLFEKHKVRFKHNVPHSLFEFLSQEPALAPTQVVEVCLFESGELYAVSFLDIGAESTSSIYAMFDPAFSHHSPGLHTLLIEIDYSIQQHKKYLYLGYAHTLSSFYDYKKRFNALEKYDWQGNWEPYNS